jgi:hypothetical protein
MVACLFQALSRIFRKQQPFLPQVAAIHRAIAVIARTSLPPNSLLPRNILQDFREGRKSVLRMDA